MADVPRKRLKREESNVHKDEGGRPTGGGGDGVPGENLQLTHEKVDTRSTTNIKMKQHLCVKHALPKTRLTNAILYENVSQGRHLDMKLSGLQHNKFRSSVNMDINKRAFLAQQDRKRRKWKREDEVRISAMNLPSLSPMLDASDKKKSTDLATPVAKRRPSMLSLYHSSGADERIESAGPVRKPVLPMMKVRRERTEIISHHDRVFVTKLPSVVEIDQQKQAVFNTYCGKPLLDRGVPSRDYRFQRLHTTLSTTKLNKEDEYPAENLTMKSRLSKYISTSPSVSEPLPPRSGARVMVASRGKPNATGLDLSVSSAPGGQRSHEIDFVTERVQRDSIVKLFKSKDLKQLARSLTSDGARLGREEGEKGGTDTDRPLKKPRHQQIFVPVVDVFYKVKTGS